MFEEFRGVLSAPAAGPLSGADYQALGVRQSLFAAGEMRAAVHELFQKYVAWLKDAKLFDLNIVSHGWRAKTEALYDFVVVDEVQDFTSAQLALIFDSLKTKDRFLLCGDAHQIVHPNFFSWASVRALFREAPRDETAEAAAARDVTVLQANFRNTRAVTALANRLLKIKQARFGSVDRESNFLVKCASPAAGEVRLLKAEEKALKALDASSRASVRSAVIVLRDEDKAAARAHFRTPLVFSVHEAKGLEYPNVILFNLVSGNRAVYADLCRDVVAADLEGDELDYRRAKDKADKSLELNKFYVNALYVAMTRAMEGLALVESDVRHPLLEPSRARGSRRDRDGPGSGVDQGRMGAGSAEARAAGQTGASAVHTGNFPGEPTHAVDPVVFDGAARMGAQGARSQKPFREDQAKHVRLRAVAWTRRLYREARPGSQVRRRASAHS